MSMSLTRNDFKTFHTKPITNSPSTGYLIGTPYADDSMSGLFAAASEAISAGINSPEFAASAVIKHLIHLASDVDTIQGLPIPNAGVFLPDKANDWLLQNGFDAQWFGNIGLQAGLATFTNTIVSVTYSWLLYDEEKYGSRAVFNEKVKKMIAVANAISASANVMRIGIDIAGADYVGAMKHLDIGGLVVAIKAMLNSKEFIKEIHDITYTFDDIKFGLSVSKEDIKRHYKRQSSLINQNFEQILLEMNAEYDKLDCLMGNAINLQSRSTDQFTATIKFAQYVKVPENKIIKTDEQGDDFFLR